MADTTEVYCFFFFNFNLHFKEAEKWVVALNELRNLFCRSGFPRKDAFLVRELCDLAAMPQLRNAQCATVIGKGRFVMGLSDQGLVSVELDREVCWKNKLSLELFYIFKIVIPVGGEAENKKRNVEQVYFVSDEQVTILNRNFIKCHNYYSC
jgi:hypothetical protein